VATLRIGTRGSNLALWQARHVAERLGPGAELVIIQTSADKRPEAPLRSFDKSLFIKEIEEALLDGRIDMAVHSLKDVPSRLDARFAIAGVLEREDARDVLLTRGSAPLPASSTLSRGLDTPAAGGSTVAGSASVLPSGARVGTSSLRREAQLRVGFPGLAFTPIRGNVDTRLRKLNDGEYDGIVLAAAGLLRLGVAIPSEAYLPVETCLPAPGQAAMCVETLAGRTNLAATLDHTPTRRAVEAERAFAAELDFGCRVPLAAYATLEDAGLCLRTLVASADGSKLVRAEGEGRDPIELGQRLAREALAKGAGELLAAAR